VDIHPAIPFCSSSSGNLAKSSAIWRTSSIVMTSNQCKKTLQDIASLRRGFDPDTDPS
jgi:hypothetical protein